MSGRMVRMAPHRRRHHIRVMHGSGILDFLSRANAFLRKHKLISTVGSALSGVHPAFGHVARGASLLGYGRRRHRRMRGGALKLAGAGLSLAGGRRRRHHRRY